MPTCPNGHQSADEEFCEVCGLEMNAAAPATVVVPEPAPETVLCPACNTPLDGRFCEACGHDSHAAVPSPVVAVAPAQGSWTATVTADRAHFDTVVAESGPDAGGITFPPFCPERHFPLQAAQITIGRRSASRGIQPDIDLTGPPEDPGVSHLHAVLLRDPDGGLSIVDLGSANGTTVNGGTDPLAVNVPRVLADGDRVHIGAWTLITVRLEGAR